MIYRIATASIALGLATMVITMLILLGFQETIQDKIYSFSAHLQVRKLTFSSSYESQPVSTQSDFYQSWRSIESLHHVQEYIYKPGLLKHNKEVYGIVLKGVGQSYDSSRITPYLKEGRFIRVDTSGYSTEVVISTKIARIMQIALHDEIMVFFIQKPVRFRKLKVVGIYETGMEDFDTRQLFCDIALVRRLNGWEEEQAGGFEVFVDSKGKIDELQQTVNDAVDADLYSRKSSDVYVQVFDWLQLLRQNVMIFLIIILVVACFNMVSILFILIMERTPMIGMLKALGSTNGQIRSIFRYNGMLIILRGMAWGNLISIGFGLIQYYFQIIPLDAENYYMEYVPIAWNIPAILGMNVLIFVVTYAILIIPTMIISRIQPIKSIRFD